MARRLALALAALGLALALPQGAAPGGTIQPYTINVTGEDAHGLLAVPAGTPLGLAVFCHGYGNTVQSWVNHLQAAADRGYLAVAMDYSPWFDLDRGAAETNAAALDLATRYGISNVVLFGVSMGGGVAGLALAEAPQRPEGDDLYTWFVDVEPVTALAETWAEAKATGHPAAAQIEAETGGTPATAPLEYTWRSPGYRAHDMSHRVQGAVVLHALNDGLVPYNQGRLMATTLRAAGVPTDMVTVLRGDPSELGTTGTNALGLPNPLGLAGHAWEGSSTHPVMVEALERLWGLLDGSYQPFAGETVIDAGPDGLGEHP